VPDDEDKRGPGLRFPPPLLPLGFSAVAWWLQQSAPLTIGDAAFLQVTGIAVLALCALLAVIALIQFRRAHTHVEPWQPTTAIIDSGLFRYSRNPIYLAFCLATLGCGLLFNSWWGIIAVLPVALLLQALVIRKEEAYLAARFGDTYLDYKRRVRRWL
jgi:protein-S-isoprenylcysteine O-methyltransferase Ste14